MKPILLSIMSFLFVAVAWADEQSDYKQIMEECKAAEQLLKDEKFSDAVNAYRNVVDRWDEFIEQYPEHDNAKAQRDYYFTQIEYAVYKPLNNELDRAKKMISEGNVKEASKLYLELAKRHKKKLDEFDYSFLTDNRAFCLDWAGHAPINHADTLTEKGEFADAADHYRFAIETYEEVHARLGEEKYANKIVYATEKLHRADFAHRLGKQLPATNFQLADFNNNTVELESFRGKPVLVVVWAAWCGSCRKALPEINEWYNENANDVRVVAINVDTIEDWDRNAREKADEMAAEYDFMVVRGDLDTINGLGSPGSVPTLIWIDSHGRLVKQVASDERAASDLDKDLEVMP